MYEMLVGYPPFYSDDPMSTCRKVTFLSNFELLSAIYITFVVCLHSYLLVVV